MDLNNIPYGLAKWKDTLCSTCELLRISTRPTFPLNFVEKATVTEIEAFLKGLGEKYYDEFVDMLIFDALIFNTDWRGGNFGLSVDNKTNKPIALAPIFDNGLSLFNYAMDDELKDIENILKRAFLRLV